MSEPANPQAVSNAVVRPLEKADLDAVVELDHRIAGESRRGYFERRLAAALRDPKRHLQVAVSAGSKLVGFALARITSGEFGRPAPTLLLEALSVDPAVRHAGIGRRMMATLDERMRARGVQTFVTHSDWHNHAMLKFLDGAGFVLAPRLVLERKVARMPLPDTDEAIEAMPPRVRHLRPEDYDMVVRIDRLATGRDRGDYVRCKLDEALHESPIAVSLVTEEDGFVVAFAMARVDIGDFGRVVQTASLDTIGVNPAFAHRGFARAMLSQMIDNLAALHVEHLETEVAQDHFELLRFFYAFGFGPSQRLVFQSAPR